jgi:hypothetical protein
MTFCQRTGRRTPLPLATINIAVSGNHYIANQVSRDGPIDIVRAELTALSTQRVLRVRSQGCINMPPAAACLVSFRLFIWRHHYDRHDVDTVARKDGNVRVVLEEAGGRR